MADIYVPAAGKRVPMPGNQPDWPEEGRAVNFSNPYEARLVRDGDLVVKPKTEKTKPAGATGAGGAQGGSK